MSKLTQYGGKMGYVLKDHTQVVARDGKWAVNEITNYFSAHPRTEAILWGVLSAQARVGSMYDISHGYESLGVLDGLLSLYFGNVSMDTLDKIDKPKIAKK